MAAMPPHIEAFIQPDVRLIVLTADATTIPEVARRLVARGFGKSAITVLENMGGAREATVRLHRRMPCPARPFSDLNTLAIHCIASPGAQVFSRLAGLPDDAFVHDGQLTKREVRAATLAALSPVARPAALGRGRGLRLDRHRMDAQQPRLRSDRLRSQ